MAIALITGITGQDGSYLADRLVAEGTEVHGIVRSFDGDSESLLLRHPRIALHGCDLADADGLGRVIDELEPDEVYNLAGISSVAQSWQIPVETGLINGVAVAAILEASWQLAKRTGKQVRVLQASSSEIFGEPAETPQTETTRIQPTSPYGAAKAYAHNLVRVYRARGLGASTCILYNHESPRRPETFVTRKITAAAARISLGMQEVLELGDMEVLRDWGWAPDYVDAMVRATRHPTPDDYLIATGEQHSVEEFVVAAFAAAGILDWRTRVRTNAEFVRPVEINRMLGNASKARSVLGWRPSVDFVDLVSRMVEADLVALRA